MEAPRCVPSLAKALTHGNVSHSIFLQLIFTDQACEFHTPQVITITWLIHHLKKNVDYHCALALVLECSQASPRANISAIRHITQAFRLVNERISRAERVTNPTMAVVMSLASYESTRGHYDRGMIHLSGLHRMIEMRGGLDRVGSEEPELMQKIYRYAISIVIHQKFRSLTKNVQS
jgi:hypothetical protein